MRLTGMFLLIVAGSAMGFYKAFELKRRIQEIIILQNVFRLLETEIYHTRSPVPLALETVACRQPEAIQRFFDNVRYAMEQEYLPLYQAWELAVERFKVNTCLREEELDAVCSFGQSLGTGDATEQLKHFQLLQQRLQYALEQAEQNFTQKARIWQYMGICVSMVVVLLLC